MSDVTRERVVVSLPNAEVNRQNLLIGLIGSIHNIDVLSKYCPSSYNEYLHTYLFIICLSGSRYGLASISKT